MAVAGNTGGDAGEGPNVETVLDAPNSSGAGFYDAFLSYARTDGAVVLEQLRPSLAQRGHPAWVDTEITGGTKWRERVSRGIEACKALVFVVSPNSVASPACRQELDDALALHKLVIPVVVREVTPTAMPAVLADLEWVLLRESDDWETGMARLVDALAGDVEWRDQHTRLAGRAREWLDSGRDSSYVLRGSDLRAAEGWLTNQEGHRQAPTREQAEYIAVSRRAAGRRLRILVGALGVGLLVAVGLAVFALIQRGDAVNETHRAQSQDLATQAAATPDPELESLLALAAYRLARTVQ